MDVIELDSSSEDENEEDDNPSSVEISQDPIILDSSDCSDESSDDDVNDDKPEDRTLVETIESSDETDKSHEADIVLDSSSDDDTGENDNNDEPVVHLEALDCVEASCSVATTSKINKHSINTKLNIDLEFEDFVDPAEVCLDDPADDCVSSESGETSKTRCVS